MTCCLTRPQSIETVWGMLVRIVYKEDGATYGTVKQLIDALFPYWHEIDLLFIQNLFE